MQRCLLPAAFVLGVAGVTGAGGCDSPCCADDSACDASFVCFEGRCAALCDSDAGCDEGERCADEGVCVDDVHGGICPYGEP